MVSLGPGTYRNAPIDSRKFEKSITPKHRKSTPKKSSVVPIF